MSEETFPNDTQDLPNYLDVEDYLFQYLEKRTIFPGESGITVIRKQQTTRIIDFEIYQDGTMCIVFRVQPNRPIITSTITIIHSLPSPPPDLSAIDLFDYVYTHPYVKKWEGFGKRALEFLFDRFGWGLSDVVDGQTKQEDVEQREIEPVRHYYLYAEPGNYALTGGDVHMSVIRSTESFATDEKDDEPSRKEDVRVHHLQANPITISAPELGSPILTEGRPKISRSRGFLVEQRIMHRQSMILELTSKGASMKDLIKATGATEKTLKKDIKEIRAKRGEVNLPSIDP